MSGTSNAILNEILYNRTIRFITYGGLYFFLFLFVGTVSFIKTYQHEKAKYIKKHHAFQKGRGEVKSQAAPIHLTDTDIQTITNRKKKKTKPDPTVSTTNNHHHTAPTIITIDHHHPTNHQQAATNVPVPVHTIKINSRSPSSSTHTNVTATTTTTSPTFSTPYNSGIPLTVTKHPMDDTDDFGDRYIPYNVARNTEKKKKCFCNEFCYILCLTDFRQNWPKDTWRLRSVYSEIIVYLSDYLTDLNIIILWSIQAWQQYKSGADVAANGVNMILMAVASCAVLLFYKLISAFAVYKATGNAWYAVLQFMDLYIFIEVYKSHKVGQKTDRLRWLSNLESIFEASPQVILQLVFLSQSSRSDDNLFIVWLGLFFSVLKLGNTAINNDALHVIKTANNVSQYHFWLRSFFRVTELTATVFLYVLLWLVMSVKWLMVVVLINFIHNTFLYCGGCLSRQIYNIFAHIVALAQLSYTIVEGRPLGVFLRGKLYENDVDDTRSKLQFPYSIFIVRYNKAKEQQKERIESSRKMRTRNRVKRPIVPLAQSPDTSMNSSCSILSSIPSNRRRRSVDDHDGTFMSVSYDSHSDMKSNMIMVPETSVSASDGADAEKSNHKKNKKAPLSEGELRLNKIDENNIMYNDDNDKEQEHKQLLNEHIKLNEVEKYKKSIGDMDGIYSYFSWVHHVAILYLNIYLSSQQPQQIMMIQRTIFSLFWLLMIGTHFADFYTEFTYLFMYCASVYFTILAMLFFWLMMEYEVINEVKKKEEIQFKTIYDAIYYGRLDAIINQFDKKQHLMGMSSDGKSPLYYASELGQIDIAEWLMHKKVVDINIGADQNRTPIYIACRVGCFEIVSLLLDEHKCKYNEPTSQGRTPLYAACREGQYAIVCLLLQQALIDINFLTNHKSCALAAACQHGYGDIVCELLAKPEIEINILNEGNYTPIFIAALGTHSEVVKLLLERPEIDIDLGARNDETLFYVSCERGMDEVVQILLDRKDYNVDINRANSKNYTPLYIAACFGHDKIIEILMKLDQTTLNQPDSIGRTPFFIACRKGNAQCVFKLLQYSPAIDIHACDEDELTPFAAACQGGSVAVVETLMKLVDRSEIIGVDRMKRTPFFMACREGQSSVVARLMSADFESIIDINQADKMSRTPLMVSVRRGHGECVQVLCNNKKIDINLSDHKNRSPLFIACKCARGASHSEVIKTLMLRPDLLINSKANGGKTALHIACELGHSSIVMLLLDHADIDVNQMDDYGISPLAIADKKLDNNVYMRMVMISMRN